MKHLLTLGPASKDIAQVGYPVLRVKVADGDGPLLPELGPARQGRGNLELWQRDRRHHAFRHIVLKEKREKKRY